MSANKAFIAAANGIVCQSGQIEMNVQIIAALVKDLEQHQAPADMRLHVTHIVSAIYQNLDHLNDYAKAIRAEAQQNMETAS